MDDQNKTPAAGPTPPPSMDPIRPPAPTPPPAPAVAPEAIPAAPTAPPAIELASPPVANAAPSPATPTSPTVPGTPPAKTPSSQELVEMLTTEPQQVADTPEPNPGTLQKVGAGFLAVLGGIFSWIIFPLAVVLILHFFVFQAYHVQGTSMNPTLKEADYLIISKVGYTEALVGRWLHKDSLYIPKRGQIIVFHYPKDPTEIFIKRVVGEPGDRVVVKNGAVTVFNSAHPNGFNPDTDYEPAGTTTMIDTDETVQPGNVFVMGDNRTPGGSYDSREWGQLRSSYIIGNAVLRLLPLDSVKVM